MATYRAYSFDGTDYTDISDYIVSNVNIPVLNTNPDFSPILQSISLQTIEDLTGSYLAEGKVVSFEIDGYKRWHGFVDSAEYDYDSKMYKYVVLNIFENLKNYTTTDLYNDGLLTGTAISTYIINGSSYISWTDVTVRQVLKAIFMGDYFKGILNGIAWNIKTNGITILDNYCISDLNIKYLGTKYDEDEKTDPETDKVTIFDFLIELCKMLGIRFHYSSSTTVKITMLDNASSVYSYGDDNTFKYSLSTLKAADKKKQLVKQKILTMEDISNPIDTHRYLSPAFFGIPYIIIDEMHQSGDDISLSTYYQHNIPTTDVVMFNELYIKNALNKSYSVGSDWYVSSLTQILIRDINIRAVRCMQTNVSTTYTVTAATINFDFGECITVLTTSGFTGTPATISMPMYAYSTLAMFTAGTYSLEAGTGTPSATGKYTIQSSTQITIRTKTNTSNRGVFKTTEQGTIIEEISGTTGTPKYIRRTYRQSLSWGDVIVIDFNYQSVTTGHGITTGSGDTVDFFGTNGIDGHYPTEQTVASSLAVGEYYIASSGELWILDTGQDVDDYAYIKPLMPKYENTEYITTDGSEETTVSFMDYLAIYRPNYSTSGDWRDDWKVIDLEDTTYGMLINNLSASSPIYDPFWLYYYKSYYQTIVRETINVDDSETPDVESSNAFVYNVADRSIDITQHYKP